MENYQDVLQNIEFALIQNYQQCKDIDDNIIARSLECSILWEVPENRLVQELRNSLSDIRNMRTDISDDIWQDCLRTVLQSVHRHSNLKQGRRDYIEFVTPFLGIQS
jgi:uncharacterized alpha-E superfamily protein